MSWARLVTALVTPLVPLLVTVWAALAGCCLIASSLWAGEARVVGTPAPDRVVVETSDASVDEVLAALAAHFGFTVERSAPAAQPIRFSGRLQGPLRSVLERILRHEAHLVVHSADARAGVSRVVLIEAKPRGPASTAAGGSTPAVTGPIAALKARLKLQQESRRKGK